MKADAMVLSMAGLSHHTAPLEVRERIALRPDAVQVIIDHLRPFLPEVVILSTCNRTELYACHQEPADLPAVFQEALAATGQTINRPYLFTYQEVAVARHLFRVASGLDSQVFGEAEILGQVRGAWEIAQAAGTARSVTSRLFQHALAVGKRVRSQTDIGRSASSVSSAAVVLAQQALGRELSCCTVLVMGTGEIGQGVVRSLLSHGVRRLLVANHRNHRAEELARHYGGSAVPWPVTPGILAQADIVVSATGASGTILHSEDVEAALALRFSRPLHLIDLALPRDIDPDVAHLPGVHLHNLDDLEAVVATNIRHRQGVLPQAEAIIEEEADSFARWLRQRQVSPTIRSLRSRSEAVRSSEVRRALQKLPNLSERERIIVDQLSTRLANKLLHVPTVRLRRAAAEGRIDGYQAVAGDLLGLADAATPAPEFELPVGKRS